jgi:hypothetical protein
MNKLSKHYTWYGMCYCDCILISMIEFESIIYIATKEIMWMQQLLSNLKYP